MSIFDASNANGGSVNNASSISNNSSNSWANSFTNGAEATASSNMQANSANALSMAMWQKTAEFNAEQARIQREWQEKMANTVYQRGIADMKLAGINPILAASFGLSSANVGSGATASMSAPEIFMGNSFADQSSASQSMSKGHSESESKGSSWSHSESGLATFLESMGAWINGLVGAISSGQTINIALNGLKQSAEKVEQASNPTSKEMEKDNYKDSGKSKGSVWDSLTKSIYGITKSMGGMGMLGK